MIGLRRQLMADNRRSSSGIQELEWREFSFNEKYLVAVEGIFSSFRTLRQGGEKIIKGWSFDINIAGGNNNIFFVDRDEAVKVHKFLLETLRNQSTPSL